MNNLKNSLFTLTAIFESLEDAVLSHDENQNILQINPAAEEVFGYSADELIGRSILDLIPEKDHAQQKELFDKVLDGGRVAHLRTSRITRAGEEFPVSLTISPIKDEMGTVIGASQTVRDITAEKEAEAKQAILASIIEASDDAIISKTLDGVITSWNFGAETIFGYKAEEVIGKHITILIPDARIAEEDYILSNIKNGVRIQHFQTTRISKEGHEIPISLTVSPVKDKEGVIIGVSKIARNISIEKLAEEKQAMLAAIVESSDDAIISKDLNGIISSWNSGAEKIFGYKEHEVLGKHISILIPQDRLDEETEIISRIRKGQKVNHFQTIRVTKTGDEIHISLTVSPVKDGNGNIIGASKVARDVTKEKKAEEEIRDLSQKKDEFIALASHELKTPLTSLSGFMQIIDKKISEPTSKILVGKSMKILEKLNILIGDLFDISKIQSGKLQFHFERIDLTSFVLDLVETVRFSQSTHQINFISDGSVSIKGDRLRLEQVLVNLINNAVKYSPGANKVDVKIATTADYAIVSIQDYGLGISKEEQQNIFSQFYRVSGLSHKISGLGLGLYITKEIIDRHSGQIMVESELGKGSVFSFKLPINPGVSY
jgi:PAS domain S-box-containing protein